MRPRRRVPLVLALGLVAAAARAQTAQDFEQVRQLEGKTIADVKVIGAQSPEQILQYLKTKPGEKLRKATVQGDLITLWTQLKVVVWGVTVAPARNAPDQVVVQFTVREERSYDRVEFRGLSEFTENEVRDRLGLTTVRRMTEFVAQNYRQQLEGLYRREGYPSARVAVRTDRETSTLTFAIDEGPCCTVRNIWFRGNRAYPAWTVFSFGRSLLGSSRMELGPADRILRGSAFSEEKVEEDLDRLRVYYRRNGYRDAQVELAEQRFSADRSQVDLTFRVIEGRRYKVRSVSIQHIDEQGMPVAKPYYSAEEILKEIRLVPGEYYDRDAINRDKGRIERFYGERGHPRGGRYGAASRGDTTFFFQPEPAERYDVEKAEIDITYLVFEGQPKKLRDVVIRGNTYTQDHVIRRKVFAFPGELVDSTKLQRSLSRLESLRYFQNPDTLTGVEFSLLPVEKAPGEVDLEIKVSEGDTGSFLWGAGVSSGAGVQARIQFNKRNFDLFNLPSSLNPITWVSEIIDSKAFHGAGQELELYLAPGTEISTFRLTFDEPDLFGTHFDTIGLRVSGFRTLRLLDSFDMDRRGLHVGLRRQFTEQFRVFGTLRQETVEVDDIDGNAPAIVWDAKGQTELRGLELGLRHTDLDDFLYPTSGYDASARFGVFGGPFGAEEDFWEAMVSGSLYLTAHRDSYDRAHVVFLQQRFDLGRAYGDSDDLFLTERYYLGGSNLRGFKQRGAGPKQFGRPLGGEARLVSRLEYQVPLVSTRVGTQTRETEILRGVLFSDAGLLGTAFDDPTFTEPRLSVGFGIRIRVPGLGLPIALDFGWPLVWEETDSRRVVYLSLSR